MVALASLPETNVALFAFLLNYPWEFIQAPLFEGMAGAPHWEAVKACTRAAMGDAAIMLIAFWLVAAVTGGRRWIVAGCWRGVLAFVLTGVAITIGIESLAVRGQWVTQWTYAASMPVVPVLGVGLVPLLQWFILPLVVAALVRRQLRGLT
jgi:hypothetical protein